MPTIRQSTESDIPAIKELLRNSYKRTNESEFFEAIQTNDTYIPALSLVAEIDNTLAGYILLSRVGIRTANEILPTLAVAPFCVRSDLQKKGIGTLLLNEGLAKAKEEDYTSCITWQCGSYFNRFGFLPARDEFGLELYFDVRDEDFRAIELQEDALYRKSGFILFPSVFSLIDPVLVS